MRTLETTRGREYPFLSRGELLMLGPEVDAARCVGRAASSDAACTRSWDVRLREATP
jgi:hypothetical protein